MLAKINKMLDERPLDGLYFILNNQQLPVHYDAVSIAQLQ